MLGITIVAALLLIAALQLDGTLDSVAEDYSLGEELKFTVLIDVYPDFELKEEDYKGLKVEVERVPFNDEAYEASLLKLRDQNANLYDAPEGAAAQADEAEGKEQADAAV